MLRVVVALLVVGAGWALAQVPPGAGAPGSVAPGSVAPGSAPAAAPPTLGALPVEGDWANRALAWFKGAEDEKARKEAMREITKAIKQPCRHCHTPDFQGYTDVQPIARQMMALSAEHGVACADCHAGKNTLTELGERARPMWALAHEQKVFCDHCHVPATRFHDLTEAGRTWHEAQRKAHKAP